MAASHTWLLAAALAVAAPLATSVRAVDEWELLGSRRVSFSAERDVIEVGAEEGAYRTIKIEVEGGNLEMFDIRLFFGDGGTWSPATRVRFREGSWSRTIDLPGPGRVIRRIEFAYRSELRQGRATVRVYGNSAGPAPVSPPARTVGDWELLGSRRVSFSGERDVMEVGAREGAYRTIKLEVEGGNLEMYDIRLTFGDGGTWSPETRVRFREGSWSRTIDLPDRGRVIRKVEFAYRSELRRGRATVRVYGKSAAPGRPGMRGYRDREGRRDGELRRDGEDPRDNPHPDRRVMEGPPAGGPGLAGWEHLGARQVDFHLDHDAVVAGGRGVFRRLRIDVEGNDLEMFSVKVTFGNGATFSPPTRLIFKEGSRSRVIDLPGTARVIRRIDFYYRSTSGVRRGRSTVHVYGRG